MYTHKIDEPKEIWNKEEFAKRDKVIKRMINYMKIACNAAAFNKGKKDTEDHPKKKEPKMAEFFRIYVARPKTPVINNFYVFLLYIYFSTFCG